MEKGVIKLQSVSDLHLEIIVNRTHIQEIPKLGDILALNGDIGDPFDKSYEEFLEKYSKVFRDVFVIAGNHEYYKNEIHATKEKITEICEKYRNVHFFDIHTKSVVVYEDYGVRFFGTTLWSDIIESRRSLIRNDYNYIKLGKKRLEPNDTVGFFNEELAWLKEEITKTKELGMTCVIFSHHSPVWEHTLLQEDHFIGDAFANKLEGMMGKPIQAWVYGHTHKSTSFDVKGTHIYSNQFGYQFRKEKSGYKLKDVKEIFSAKDYEKNNKVYCLKQESLESNL